MINDKTITCFIPAKGASTRMPGKNTRVCNGNFLVMYPIHLSKSCGIFDRTVISSEDHKVFSAASLYDDTYDVHMRSEQLAREKSSVWDAVQSWAEINDDIETDYICLLHPTSPCLKPETVVTGIRMMIEAGHESLISVTKVSPYHFGGTDTPDFSVSTGTQFEEEHFSLNNAIHVIPWKYAANGISIYKTDWIWYPIPSDEGIDIDTETDLKMAEAILQWRQHETQKPTTGDL